MVMWYKVGELVRDVEFKGKQAGEMEPSSHLVYEVQRGWRSKGLKVWRGLQE